jgi:hypothetical protein
MGTPEAADLTPETLAYLERVLQLTERLSVREVGPDDVEAALEAVRDVAPVDADAPTGSARPEARLLKTGIKRLVAWYMTYLAEQVNDLGFALLRLGETLTARVERSDVRCKEMAARLSQLEEKVRRLEGTERLGEDVGHDD